MIRAREKFTVPRLRFKGCESAWTKERLSRSLHIRRGLTYAPGDIVTDGVRVLRSSNIDVDIFAFQDDDVFVRKSAVNIPFAQNGQILITAANGSTNLVGKHAVVQGVGKSDAVAGGFMLLGETETPNYVNAWMSAPWYRRFRSEFVMGGNGALGNLNKSGFELFEAWSTQEIKEKMLIGKSFDALDGLIQFQKRCLSALRQLKRVMLVKMFPRPGQSVPEIRFNGFDGEWEYRHLGCYLRPSGAKNGVMKFSREDVLSVSGEYGIVNQIKFKGRSFAGASVSNYGVVENGDIVYTKSPLNQTPYGIIKANLGPAGIVSTLYAVYKVGEGADPSFVQTYFSLDGRLNSYLRPLVRKGAKNDMKVSAEGALRGGVIFPSLAEQRKISAFFRNLDRMIGAAEKKVAKLRQVKSSLLERMFV